MQWTRRADPNSCTRETAIHAVYRKRFGAGLPTDGRGHVFVSFETTVAFVDEVVISTLRHNCSKNTQTGNRARTREEISHVKAL